MSGFYIGAILAIAGAGYAAWRVYGARHRLYQLLRTETVTTGVLKQLHEAATTAAGFGAYSDHVELEGTAQPGPVGPLTSEISETPCVWYRQKVTRRYRDVYRDKDGHRRERTREEVVAESASTEPFHLKDADGEVVVVPTERAVQGARKSVSRFEKGNEQGGGSISIGGFKLNLGGRRDNETLGYEYEEWILTPGTRIFVNGQATDRGGQLEVVEPEGKAKLVISTKSEQHLIDAERRTQRLYSWAGAGAAVLAVILAVVGVLR